MGEKKKVTLLDRIKTRLVKAGLTERKAKELAKAVVPTARTVLKGNQPKTLLERLSNKFQRVGVTERKAKELAKAVGPIARNTIKKEGPRATKTVKEQAQADGVELRTDLPVLGKEGGKSAEVMQSMMGLTSGRTYIVAAVKGEDGIVAIRKLTEDCFNVKFYPTMETWAVTSEELGGLGANSYLAREWYQRMHFPQRGVDQLLARLEAQAKSKSRVKALKDRLKAVTLTPLLAAFGRLYGRVAA